MARFASLDFGYDTLYRLDSCDRWTELTTKNIVSLNFLSLNFSQEAFPIGNKIADPATSMNKYLHIKYFYT